ncbi:MAG: hypothetical protein KAS32_15865 [Candidatus Peribacteraceae bacterium]|nr:hypothetical protein [Candidatus Peribacteraceae bacterium]
MKKIIYLAILAILIYGVVWAGGTREVSKNETGNLPIVETGDTAQITLFHTVIGVDSFSYIDTFSYRNGATAADTTAHQTITWLSPLQVARIDVSAADSSTVYSCSVGFQDDTLGFDVDPSDAHSTVAKIVDTLVYLFNNTTNLKDSVLAQDSVTYVKLVSKFSQLTFDGRWEVQFGVTGGAGTLDTSASTIVTEGMVSDSLPGYINADAGLDSFMTAVNSGDTGYTVTSDDAGILFYAAVVNHADTGGTKVEVLDNFTGSWSGITDTIYLNSFIDPGMTFNSMMGKFKIFPSAVTTQGIGLSDSGYVWVYSEYLGNTNLLAVDTTASLPCSVLFSIPSAAGTDTLLTSKLFMVWRVADTASDTTTTIPYRITTEYILRENP